jgi:hypothetical protein
MDDFYDEDLPEVYVPWAESLKEKKDVLLYAGKFVAIPTGLFVLTCIANYYINKKLGPL